MVTSDEFRRIASARGIEIPPHSGGALRVESSDLQDAIRLAKDLDLVVLGLDGLLQDGAVLLPLDEFAADLGDITGSWPDRVSNSFAEASGIAEAWGSTPTVVELTLEGINE